jgi:glycosyltransferase involved in cell wall biosynthesis
MSPLISILIPCHNAARWLPETLESALAQTWPRREVVVVDDGSTDDSLAVARRFEPRGVRVIAQANRGASAARNAAWRASQGEWLQFLDADDLLAPDKIALQFALAASTGPDFALCSRWTRFTTSFADADFRPQPLCCDSDPVSWMVRKLGDSDMMHPAAWLTSRQLLDRAGPWNESLSLDDDGEFFSRVVLASRGVRHSPAAVSYYRSNLAGSLSARHTAAAWRSAFLSHQLCAEGLLRQEESPRTRRACANLFQRLAYAVYLDCPELLPACVREVRRYGGSDAPSEGGAPFRFATKLLGWKAAKQLQRLRARF